MAVITKDDLGGSERALKEHDEFYIAYGRAMMRWGSVEHTLASLYVVALGLIPQSDPANPDPLEIPWLVQQRTIALAAYYEVVNWRSRLSMTGAAIGALHISSALDGNWKTLHDRAKKKATKRNKFAHLGVAYNPDAKPGNMFSLIDNSYKAKGARKSDRFFTSDLVRIEEEFVSLALAISDFEDNLSAELRGRRAASLSLLRSRHP